MAQQLSDPRAPTGRIPGPVASLRGRGRGLGDDRWRHRAALALLLFALIPVAGRQAVWSADEGALLYQIDAVADGRGWVFDHPFPAADPGGTGFAIHLASWAADDAPAASDGDADCGGPSTDCRYIVLAKHGLLLRAAAALYGLGGYTALLLASVLASLVAAVATSRLAAEIEPAAGAPALWVAGVASPLFVGSYVAWAHTLGAALIGWATVWLLSDRRPLIHRPLGLLLIGAACLVRTEAALAGFAIGLGLMTAAVLRRSAEPRLRQDRLLTGAAAIWAAGLGLVADRLTDEDSGGPVEPVPFDQAFGFVEGRLEAFAITWLRPAYGADPRDLLIMAGAGLTVAAGILARRGSTSARAATALLALAATCFGARLILGPAALIPGLLMAFPVLFVGLVVLDRRAGTEDRTAEILFSFVLFCGAVLATQYRHGGGGEWGGRYFAVGLPLGIAVSTVGLTRAGWWFRGRDRRRLAALLAVSMAVLSTMGLVGLRTVRDQTEALAIEVDRTLDRLEEAGEDPVVVTTVDGAGRWLWEHVDRGRWLRVSTEELPELGARLDDLDVDRLVLISPGGDRDLDALAPWFRVDATGRTDGSQSREGPEPTLTVVTLTAGS